MSKWVNRFLVALAIATAGCGDDDDAGSVPLTPGGSGGTGGSSSGGSGGSGGAQDPLGRYVMGIITFGLNNTATTYVTQVDSLDVTNVDSTKGREFGGQANIAAYDGHLFVSSGEAPTITRFALNGDGTLTEEGTVSFANFGVPTVSVDAAVNTFISPTKAYIFGDDGTQVVWNPTTMEIVTTVTTPNLTRDGFFGVTSSSGLARGNRLYRVLYWSDLINYVFSDEQLFAVYDTDTDTLVSLTPETRCPTLGALAFTDEGGTGYFSNWFYNVPGTLQQGKPQSCMLRLPPGSDTLDPSWAPKFSELNGGHEGAQLSFAGGRRGIFSTLHEEALTITPETTPYQIASSPNWEPWAFDLAAGTAAPLQGIERFGAQQSIFQIDGRTFLLAPNKEFTESKAYEINADGTSRLAFTIAGWSRAFIKIK